VSNWSCGHTYDIWNKKKNVFFVGLSGREVNCLFSVYGVHGLTLTLATMRALFQRFRTGRHSPPPPPPTKQESVQSPQVSDTDTPPTPKLSTASTVKLVSPPNDVLLPLPQPNNDDDFDLSLRSGTPYSQMSNKTNRVQAATSWSETAEDDLVSNLGSRERTRQEVLFEILASEERYVAELFKMKDTFIDPLLHPYATFPISSTRLTESDDYSRIDSPLLESTEYLPPIAARFMSPSPFMRSDSPATIQTARKAAYTPNNIDRESIETDDDDEEADDHQRKPYSSSKSSENNHNHNHNHKHNHPRSPYRNNIPSRATTDKTSVPFPSRSHHSLPPQPRVDHRSSSTHSLGRQSSITERERNYSQSRTTATTATAAAPSTRVLRKFKKSTTTPEAILGGSVAPHQLPEDLRMCLEVVDASVLEGHRKLSEALRKRYEEQYPLVRSLADVFVSHVRPSFSFPTLY
jgi:hypothetical protein